MLAIRADLQAVCPIPFRLLQSTLANELDVEKVNLLLKLRIMRRWLEGMLLLIRVLCESSTILIRADESDRPPRGKNWQDIR